MISIIIVNWNAGEYVAYCLASLEIYESPRELEILVVDNASKDGSATMIRRRFPRVNLIQNSDNVGFARANNQAIEHSHGQYILLLNPDTEVLPGSLDALVRFLEEHPEAGAAGARLLGSDRTLQVSCHPGPTLSRECWRLFHLESLRSFATYRMQEWDQKNPREVDILQGACLMIRREALQEVGLLDEDYFIYSEEVDLCRRLQQKGWKLFWVPEAEVIHYGGQSTLQVKEAMFLQLYRSKTLYFRKHFGSWHAKAYKLILALAAISRQVLVPLAFFNRADQRRHDQALAHYYRNLLKALPGL